MQSEIFSCTSLLSLQKQMIKNKNRHFTDLGIFLNQFFNSLLSSKVSKISSKLSSNKNIVCASFYISTFWYLDFQFTRLKSGEMSFNIKNEILFSISSFLAICFLIICVFIDLNLFHCILFGTQLLSLVSVFPRKFKDFIAVAWQKLRLHFYNNSERVTHQDDKRLKVL